MAESMEALPSVAHSAQQVSDPEEVRTRQCGWLLKRSGGHSSNSAKSASRMLSFGSIAKKWDTRFVQVVPGAVVWGAERAELADDAGAKRFELAGCRLEMRSEAKASLKGWLPRFKLVHPDRTLTFEVPSGGVKLALLKEALASWSSVLLAAIKSADDAQEAAERVGEGGAALDAAVPSSDDGEGEGEDAPVALPGPSIPPLAIQARKRFESQDFGAHSSDEECVSPETRQRSSVLSRWLCRCATSAWLGLQCAAPSRVPSPSEPPRTHARVRANAIRAAQVCASHGRASSGSVRVDAQLRRPAGQAARHVPGRHEHPAHLRRQLGRLLPDQNSGVIPSKKHARERR